MRAGAGIRGWQTHLPARGFIIDRGFKQPEDKAILFTPLLPAPSTPFGAALQACLASRILGRIGFPCWLQVALVIAALFLDSVCVPVGRMVF